MLSHPDFLMNPGINVDPGRLHSLDATEGGPTWVTILVPTHMPTQVGAGKVNRIVPRLVPTLVPRLVPTPV